MSVKANSPKDPKEVMGQIFGEFGNEAISDIQVRSGLPVYCHTRNGLEIVDRLGDFYGGRRTFPDEIPVFPSGG